MKMFRSRWLIFFTIGAISSAIAIGFSSCGGKDSAEDDATPTAVLVADASVGGDVEIAGHKVSYPEGALSKGVQLTLKEVAMPEDFSAVAEQAVPASKVLQLEAKEGGTIVLQAAKAVTVSLKLNEVLPLTEDGEKSESLCVLAVAGDSKVVYSVPAIVLAEGKDSVAVETQLLGSYMAAQCTDGDLPGFEHVPADSADPKPDTDGEPSGELGKGFPFACHNLDANLCVLYKSSAQSAEVLASFCTPQNGKALLKVCPPENFEMSCDSSTDRLYLYKGHTQPTGCEGTSSTVYAP